MDVSCSFTIFEFKSELSVVVKHIYPSFQLHKKDLRSTDKQFICEVMNEDGISFYYSFEDEARRDSFSFFLITQRRILASPPSGIYRFYVSM